jgi:hypothetical protein
MTFSTLLLKSRRSDELGREQEQLQELLVLLRLLAKHSFLYGAALRLFRTARIKCLLQHKCQYGASAVPVRCKSSASTRASTSSGPSQGNDQALDASRALAFESTVICSESSAGVISFSG